MTRWTAAAEEPARAVLGRDLRKEEREAFAVYLRVLTEWQATQRLVGSIEPDWVFSNLFVDSLLFLRVLPQEARDVLDLGSGAGVPGIPLKIVKPEFRVTLLEGHRKRASFLRAAVRAIGLVGVDVVNERAESWLRSHGRRFDAVVMRCAGSPDVVLGLALGALRSGGIAVATGAPDGVSGTKAETVTVQGAREGATRTFLVATVKDGSEPKSVPARAGR